MKRVLLTATALVLVPVVLLAAAVGAVLGGGGLLPSPLATASIPADYLALYQQAAQGCPGLPWTVLAAIGAVESDHGRSSAPGVHAGANQAGAEGPMQFLPATFAAYAEPAPPGGVSPPSPYDPADAIVAAARLLCANGASGGTDIPAAVFAYNHSSAYVTHVITVAARYGATAGGSATAEQAVRFALAQLGTPYRWGGDGPAEGGFDCSGLVQVAYVTAGVQLPRVAQAQYDAGPHLPPDAELRPGDLVFFGTSPSHVTHVGIVVGPGQMVDAPTSGAVVRIESYQRPSLLAATRPAG